MKCFAVCFMLVFLLTGCNAAGKTLDPAIDARNLLTNCNGCTFTAQITADYGENIYVFKMNCEFDSDGNMKFTVVEPDSIESITGQIDSSGGELTFDDTVLAFPVLADELITPVSAPWFMLNGLKSGYLVACGNSESGYQIKIDDNYNDHMFRIDIWTDENLSIMNSEIVWDGYRILTIEVKDYKVL